MSVTINGTNGITFNNGSVQPSAASMIFIGSATASSSATIDFTNISNTTYGAYRLYLDNVIPTNNAVNLLLRFSNGGTFATGGYNWQNWRWTTAGQAVTGQGSGAGTGIALDAAGADNISNAASLGGSWVIDIFDCSLTNGYNRVNYQGFYFGSTWLGVVGNGTSPSTTAIDGFRLLMDSGTIAQGTFRLYGIKNA